MNEVVETETLAAHLADNLRSVRQRRRLTQDKLARRCGIPRSTVAQLETGLANPTLQVLARLSSALQLSLEELLSAPHAQLQHFPRGSLPIASRGRGDLALVQRLLPDPIPGMEIDRLELAPGAHMPGIPHRAGTREYLACERGRLTLWTTGERVVLSQGDVAAFQGDQPHSYRNEGAAAAVGFSVVVFAPAVSVAVSGDSRAGRRPR